MHRSHLIQALLRYAAQYPEEKSIAEEITTFIQAHADCFERTQLKGHVTGSAWLLSADEKKALLTHHAKLQQWLQLGGHADGDSDIQNVALREAQEESGINNIIALSNTIFDIDVHLIPERKNEPAHKHYDIRYLFKVARHDALARNNHESLELRWFLPGEITAELVDASVMRLKKKWAAYILRS